MGQQKLSDAILVLSCQQRDEAAFRELVDRWEPRLYYYLRRILENESNVWDVLQETWLAVFQKIRQLEDCHKFPAWLYQIAHNKAMNLLQKENKYVQMINEQMVNNYENNISISLSTEQVILVHQVMEKLKFPHREVLTLYFLEGFSIREMSQIIGVSEGTVKSRLFYAKNKIRESIERCK